MNLNDPLKTCINCRREKPLREFNKKAAYLHKYGDKDGHTSMCKVCAKLRSLKGRCK